MRLIPVARTRAKRVGCAATLSRLRGKEARDVERDRVGQNLVPEPRVPEGEGCGKRRGNLVILVVQHSRCRA